MKRISYLLTFFIAFVGCTDLTEKMYNDLNKDNYYTSEAEYRSVFMNQYNELRKIYGWGLYYLQELTTDEACLPQKGRDGYDGGNWQSLHWHTWTPQHTVVNETWVNLYGAVGFCNQIIEDVELSTILPESQKSLYIAESRAMRAFFYAQLMDLYGNIPIVTRLSEQSPSTKNRVDVFAFIEKELTEVYPTLLRKSASSYGRFTQESALALLSRIYLNAEVYTGRERWDDCIRVSKELLAADFKLDSSWDAPFVWENENSKENIFVIPQDEILANDLSPMFYRNIHWSMTAPIFDWKGSGGWNAICTVRDFIETYDVLNDKRCKYDPRNGQYGQFIWGPQFDKDGNPILGTNEYAGQQLDLTLDLPDMINNKENAGARNIKYKIKPGATGMANDVVVFRLAEIYFNCAEASLRKGQEIPADVLSGINLIRRRACVGEYTSLTLDELYDEKGREMCYELTRRTDMVRFGTFVEPMWDKKQVDEPHKTIFPIPYLMLNINPNLKQNDGY